MRKHLKKTKIMFNQLYIVASWMNFSKIIIKIDKTKTSQIYDKNTSNSRWKIYFDESEKNENVTTAAMNFNWNMKKRLKNVSITFTHHDELKNLIMIVEKLIKHYKKTTDARNKIYKIYFDNQALLKVIHVISLMFD